MKNFFRIWVVIFAAAVSGCSKLPDPIVVPKKIVQNSCSCRATVKTVFRAGKNELEILNDEFLEAFGRQKNCINFTPRGKTTMEISFETTFVNENQEKIFSSTRQMSATLEAVAVVKTAAANHTISSSASVQIQGSKILGLGQTVEISDDDRAALLNFVAQKIGAQLSQILKTAKNSEICGEKAPDPAPEPEKIVEKPPENAPENSENDEPNAPVAEENTDF